MWIVPAAVLVLGVVAFLVLRGGDGGGILGGGPDDTIPEFEFTVARTTPISVKTEDPTELTASAEQAAAEVEGTMTELYTEAFLDPANWREGSYDEVWPLFDEAAAAAAQGDVEILTIGATAGDGFDTIQPARNRLRVTVLLDADGNPVTAVAVVRFTATAEGKDGGKTAIVSAGQYFLEDAADGWRIVSYSVDRDDHEKVPKPGPSTTPSAAAS